MQGRDTGERPATAGPRRTHHPAAHVIFPSPARQRHQRLKRFLFGRRLRLQAAGLLALALIALLTFVLLPARQIRIVADGDVTTVRSRSANEVAVVQQAGIELEAADRVETTDDGTIAVDRATEATLTVDGTSHHVRTQATTIEELLREAGIPLQPEDSVYRNDAFVPPSESLAPQPARASLAAPDDGLAIATTSGEPVAIEVRRPLPFTVVENGQPLDVRSSRETVAMALRDVGISLGPGDRVQPPLDVELTAGLEIRVEHAAQVVVTLPAGKTILYTLADTVGEALAESAVALPADYRLEPPAETPIAPGMAVHVIGISNEQELETERIASETIYQPDPSLPWGETRMEPGRDGVRYRQYAAVYEDGQLVSRELVAEWFDPEPVDTVIYYSTASAPTPTPAPSPTQAPVLVSTPGGLPAGLNVVATLTVYATWYNAASAGRSPADPSYGLTATGIPVDRGVCAVDPSVIPLGTRFYVPGYGLCLAADIGGGIRGNMIDLGYPDGVVSDWTSQWVDIYILGP